MNNFDNSLEREQVLSESIKKLKLVNSKLAKLSLEKEQLTNEIISALGHNKEGQRTYEYSKWSLEVKTPYNYSLDKAKYKSGEVFIPYEFNPIKTSESYTVDKKLCEEYMQTSPESVRKSLRELITKKPGKPSVTIKDRIL